MECFKWFKCYIKKKNNNNFTEIDIKKNNYITTSFKVYKDRTKSSFALLDSIRGENVYRIYPHELFCDTLIKDRCITHDNKNIFYTDDNHLSHRGNEMVNDIIIKTINKIDSNF